MAIDKCSTQDAPWFVVPADRKWFTRLAVAAAIVDTIESLDPQYPKADPKVKAELQKVREALAAEVRAVTAKATARKK